MRRLLIFVAIVLSFLIFGIIAMKSLNEDFEMNSRYLLAVDTEKSKELKTIFPKIQGDYLIAYDGIENSFNCIYLNQNLTLVDKENESYASINYYKEQNIDNYLKILGENFDEPMRDSIVFTDSKPIINIDDVGKDLYKNSIKEIKKFIKIIQEDGVGYSVQDNNQWLKIFETFGYETEEIVNEKEIKKFSEKVKKDDQLQKKVYVSFLKLYIPKIECSTEYCTYEKENINDITEEISENMFSKIQYEFEIKEEYEKIDLILNEKEQQSIEEENTETAIEEDISLESDPLTLSPDELDSVQTSSEENNSPTSQSSETTSESSSSETTSSESSSETTSSESSSETISSESSSETTSSESSSDLTPLESNENSNGSVN